MNFDQGVEALSQTGLNIFLSTKVLDIPENIFLFSKDQKEKNLCLIAHGGNTLWKNIDQKTTNPIDSFSLSQMQWFATNILNDKIEILFPNDQHTIKLQQLGRFLGLSSQSPLGIDISNEFGLWFAFRGVFLTKKTIPFLIKTRAPFPCESCNDKPCLKEKEIKDGRLKCPVHIEHQYSKDQLDYHQTIIN